MRRGSNKKMKASKTVISEPLSAQALNAAVTTTDTAEVGVEFAKSSSRETEENLEADSTDVYGLETCSPLNDF